MQANVFKRSAVALAVAGAFVTGAITADRIGVNAAHAAAGAAGGRLVGTLAKIPFAVAAWLVLVVGAFWR